MTSLIKLFQFTMMQRNFLRATLFATTLTAAAMAQTFTPIVGDYQCAEFSDGAQFLVKATNTGFQLVKTSDVKESFNKERRILKQRLRTTNELLREFKSARISQAKFIGGANKILKKIFGDDAISTELPPSEAESAVEDLKQRILDRDAILGTISDLINNCESGINSKKGKGTPIGITLKPVSIATTREIYGGFVVYAAKRKNQFSKKPMGFRVCLKLVWPGGEIGKLYTGFGDEGRCGTGTLIFEGVPPKECDALIPKGQVGYILEKSTYDFLTLPNATTAELLDIMRLEVLKTRPTVGVLALPTTLSEVASQKACDAF